MSVQLCLHFEGWRLAVSARLSVTSVIRDTANCKRCCLPRVSGSAVLSVLSTAIALASASKAVAFPTKFKT